MNKRNLILIDGRARVLFRSPQEWVGALAPSPDGKFLAFARETTGANVRLLENF